MKKFLPVMFAFISGSTIAATSSSPTEYVVREIGSSYYTEPVPHMGPQGIAEAALGTGVAAELQSQPIRLKQNTDYACKYTKLISADLDSCSSLK